MNRYFTDEDGDIRVVEPGQEAIIRSHWIEKTQSQVDLSLLPDLGTVLNILIDKMNKECSNKITAGFIYEGYSYPSGITDQLNMNSLASNPEGGLIYRMNVDTNEWNLEEVTQEVAVLILNAFELNKSKLRSDLISDKAVIMEITDVKEILRLLEEYE